MKVLKVCDRCGHDVLLTKETDLEEIKCPHCNKVFVISKHTDKWIVRVLFALIIILAVAATFVQQKLEVSFIVVLLPMVLVGLYARRFLTWFFMKINKLRYIAIDEVEE